MAEQACHDGLPRRPSFRKTLADHAEAGLPHEYLEDLEQKRKQLDESIHKYIASKEREFRQYEKELRSKQQRKLAGVQDNVSKPRRTSSESTQDTLGSPRLLGQQQSSVVDVLLASGLKREHIGQSVALAVVDDDGPAPTLEATKASAGLTDRRASTDRNKDFIGVFTPAFLPALESTSEAGQERSSSTPALNSLEKLKRANENGNRANSDTAVDALAEGPPQLQLVQRSSSSGSSTDAKLTSALKSPTQQSKSRRKRVSLAVGDTIVAPSDNVPVSTNSNNSTPSHSRTRAPRPEREESSMSSKQPQSLDTAMSAASPAPVSNGNLSKAVGVSKPTSPPLEATPSVAWAVSPSPTSPRKIDPDGDLFDLHEEDDSPAQSLANEDPFESDDDITGRVNSSAIPPEGDELYDSNDGLVPNEADEHAEHVEFLPGSAVASQQPTNPGFRRPSASYDPIYRGSSANYEKAEEDAANNEIYGSSFTRPSNKGSFTAGSVGESFMAQNAERMMRNRARDETEVRS